MLFVGLYLWIMHTKSAWYANIFIFLELQVGIKPKLLFIYDKHIANNL